MKNKFLLQIKKMFTLSGILISFGFHLSGQTTLQLPASANCTTSGAAANACVTDLTNQTGWVDIAWNVISSPYTSAAVGLRDDGFIYFFRGITGQAARFGPARWNKPGLENIVEIEYTEGGMVALKSDGTIYVFNYNGTMSTLFPISGSPAPLTLTTVPITLPNGGIPVNFSSLQTDGAATTSNNNNNATLAQSYKARTVIVDNQGAAWYGYLQAGTTNFVWNEIPKVNGVTAYTKVWVNGGSYYIEGTDAGGNFLYHGAGFNYNGKLGVGHQNDVLLNSPEQIVFPSGTKISYFHKTAKTTASGNSRMVAQAEGGKAYLIGGSAAYTNSGNLIFIVPLLDATSASDLVSIGGELGTLTPKEILPPPGNNGISAVSSWEDVLFVVGTDDSQAWAASRNQEFVFNGLSSSTFPQVSANTSNGYVKHYDPICMNLSGANEPFIAAFGEVVVALSGDGLVYSWGTGTSNKGAGTLFRFDSGNTVNNTNPLLLVPIDSNEY